MEQNLFGQILVNLNLITEKQLAYVLSLQQRREPKPLGELLVEQDLLDERTVNTILSIQTRRMKVDKTREDRSEEEFRARMQDADLWAFLKVARESGASHLYLGAGDVPTLRLHGNLKELSLEALSPERATALLASLLDDAQRARFERDNGISLCMEREGLGRFRANLFRHTRGACGIFRLISEEIWSFDRLGLPAVVTQIATKSNGLVLITGPSRSGKSTTLASLVDHINRHQRRHIVTIEDPIEAVHKSQKSLISHRQVGTHTRSFATALRSALREDPDVLVIGEMRDAETTATAITAAETGHLVFGTLHTRNSYRTIIRILDQFPAAKRANVRTILAGVLRGIVSQDLVPNLDGNGVSLAYEVLVVNAATANLIREDRIWQIPMAMQLGTADGMSLMDDNLLTLVKAGKISLEEGLGRATEKEKFVHIQEIAGAPALVTAGARAGGAGRRSGGERGGAAARPARPPRTTEPPDDGKQ